MFRKFTQSLGLVVCLLTTAAPSMSFAQCDPPVITSQPVDASICESGNTSFSVTAIGTTLSYQWQVNDGSGFSDLSNTGIYSNATTATLTITGASASFDDYVYRCNITGGCTPSATSDVVKLDVSTPITITDQPENRTICEGNNTNFEVGIDGNNASYQWQVNTGSAFTNISNGGMYSGAKSKKLVISGVTIAEDGYKYRCVISNDCNTRMSNNNRTLTVRTLPTITGNPDAVTLCEGNNTSFSVTATGTTLNYDWQVNDGTGFVNLNDGSGHYSGVSTPTLNVSNIDASLNGYRYRCRVSGACTPAVNSSNAVLTVNALPVITTPPTAQVICDGQNTSFDVIATGTSLTYKWQLNSGSGFTDLSNGGIYSGATTNKLNITAATTSVSGYVFRCIISNDCNTITTNSSTLTVRSLPTVTSSPANVAICEGVNTSFSVTATGTGINYDWQVNNGSGFANLNNGGGHYSGVNTPTLNVSNIDVSLNGYIYRCRVSGACTPAVNSGNAVLTVNAPAVVTTQPAAQVICDGQNTSFGVTATGTTLTYKWQVNNGSGFTDVSNSGIYSGATTNQLNLTAATTSVNGYTYRCILSNLCTPVTTNAVLLTVNARPSITAQPVNTIACENSNTSFTVTNAGTGITYQWQVNTGSGFTNITNNTIYSNATTATLNITGAATSMTGYVYRCVLDNGNCKQNTANATLTVNALPKITTGPSSVIICEGDNTSLSVTASGTGITYQWQVNSPLGYNNVSNGGIYSGATTATLSFTAATTAISGVKYRCIVSGTCTPVATSTEATITVNARPVILTSPIPSIVCTGTNTQFDVFATGTALTYQWQGDNGSGFTNIVNGGVYSGATTDKLILTAPTAAITGYKYRCIVSGTCTPVRTSASAMLTVNDVEVMTQSGSAVTCENDVTIFNTTAKGVVMGYQWQVNNGTGFTNVTNNLSYAGANTNTLTITNTPAIFQRNIYRCIITGICTKDTTQNMVLTVNDMPEIDQDPSDVTAKEGSNVVFDVAASGYKYYYSWQATTNKGQSYVTVTDNANYAGATTNKLTITNVSIAQTGYGYRCVVREIGACGFQPDSSTTAYMTVTSTLSAGTVTNKQGLGISVYPNPVSGSVLNVSISGNVTGDIQVRIVNTLGMETYKGTIAAAHAGNAQISIDAMPAGVYMLYTADKAGNATGTVRFVKQ